MKRAWHKVFRCELLCDYILFGCPVIFSGGLLILQITKIADRTAPATDSVRFAALTVVVFSAIGFLAGIILYRRSASYLLWYHEILDSVPVPLIVTDEEARWRQVNKAAREIMDLKEPRDFENWNSRHLVNQDGNIRSGFWACGGRQYRVAGKNLYCGGKKTGYLIFLNSENRTSASAEIRAEMTGKYNRQAERFATEAGYFRDCANSISNQMIWQSGIIADLIGIIDELISGKLDDPKTLQERIRAVTASIERQAESSRAELEQMRRIIQILNDRRGVDGRLRQESGKAHSSSKAPV